jgi:hypothetical protein
MAHFADVEKALNAYYVDKIDQIKFKSSNFSGDLAGVVVEISTAKDDEMLRNLVQKLVTMIVSSEKDDYSSDIKEEELIENLSKSNEMIHKTLPQYMGEVNKKIKDLLKWVEDFSSRSNIWRIPPYRFSEVLKHSDIGLVNSFHARSQNTQGYKFAVLEPDVESRSDKRCFHFRIKEYSSNWIAVGVCHKNIVVSKGYAFNFNVLGHGGYMISSNGGTWSNTNADFNNKIKVSAFLNRPLNSGKAMLLA